jgi:hypothetical protein
MSKPKLSGAARRKQARMKAQARMEGAPAKPLSAELLPPMRAEDLEGVRDYRHQINWVYARMISGEILPENGTKLAYVLQQGAGLARIEQELAIGAAVRDALLRREDERHLVGHGATALLAEDSIDAPQITEPVDDEGAT